MQCRCVDSYAAYIFIHFYFEYTGVYTERIYDTKIKNCIF